MKGVGEGGAITLSQADQVERVKDRRRPGPGRSALAGRLAAAKHRGQSSSPREGREMCRLVTVAAHTEDQRRPTRLGRWPVAEPAFNAEEAGTDASWR
jgi:hypothetical protein